VFENLIIENLLIIVNWALKILVRRTRWVWATPACIAMRSIAGMVPFRSPLLREWARA